MVDRILKAIKAWIDRREKPVPRPVLVRTPVVDATADSGLCTRCGHWCACGWTVDGDLVCNLCARPDVLERYGDEHNDAPTLPLRLAGDPG
ncbi:MAG: hypothetical protein M3547_01085 [Acidobacteriota bacterium]|nr:hypothetical protein [Acidobacteriota bacterium]